MYRDVFDIIFYKNRIDTPLSFLLTSLYATMGVTEFQDELV